MLACRDDAYNLNGIPTRRHRGYLSESGSSPACAESVTIRISGGRAARRAAGVDGLLRDELRALRRGQVGARPAGLLRARGRRDPPDQTVVSDRQSDFRGLAADPRCRRHAAGAHGYPLGGQRVPSQWSGTAAD